VTDLDVVVVGGGQAGLTASYYLSQAALSHVVLEAGPSLGNAWRRRWESLELFTAARYSALPALPFPGDPERFPGKDEVADYLERYAQTLDIPIKLATRAVSLQPCDRGYRIETGSGVYEAKHVIVATGAYQRPVIPPIAQQLADDVVQLHSSEYRNPEQLAAGDVLVVGAANSGAQIAEDLAASHRVHLSQGAWLPHLPRRLLGRSLHWWLDHVGFMAVPLDSRRGRRPRGDVLIGTNLRRLARRHNVTIVGRTVDAAGRSVKFADGRALEPESVVWATGFRSDYSWITAGVLDERGAPIHRRGVTKSAGLYFLGMHKQYSRGSSLIGWVHHDATFIVDRIRDDRETGSSIPL
jgi:putative flavoprotein involved in K+ transport